MKITNKMRVIALALTLLLGVSASCYSVAAEVTEPEASPSVVEPEASPSAVEPGASPSLAGAGSTEEAQTTVNEGIIEEESPSVEAVDEASLDETEEEGASLDDIAEEEEAEDEEEEPEEEMISPIIVYGNMKFSYNYGGTWDSSTHSYEGGNSGWDMSYLDGVNNRISVGAAEGSMKLYFDLGYEPASVDSPVSGFFSESNDSVRSLAAYGSTDGAYSDYISVGPLAEGTASSLYFGLVGTPDKGVSGSALVGKIHIRITSVY